MDAASTVRLARQRAALTLRALARRAETSHSTLAAYEAGRKQPTVETLRRIAGAAGFDLTLELNPRVGSPDPGDRGRELVEVLELAEEFPSRPGARLTYPPFGALR